MFTRIRGKNERMAEIAKTQNDIDIQTIIDRKIETKSLQEGLRLVSRQKLFAVDQLIDKKGEDDQYAQMANIDKKLS